MSVCRYRTVGKHSQVDESLFGNKSPVKAFAVDDKKASPVKAGKSLTSKLRTNTALQPIQPDVVMIRRYTSDAHACFSCSCIIYTTLLCMMLLHAMSASGHTYRFITHRRCFYPEDVVSTITCLVCLTCRGCSM